MIQGISTFLLKVGDRQRTRAGRPVGFADWQEVGVLLEHSISVAVGTDDKPDQSDDWDAHQEQERCGLVKAPEASREAPAHFSPPAPGCPVDTAYMLHRL